MYKRQELEAVIDAIASDSPYAGPVKMKMDLGVDVLPKFSKAFFTSQSTSSDVSPSATPSSIM